MCVDVCVHVKTINNFLVLFKKNDKIKFIYLILNLITFIIIGMFKNVVVLYTEMKLFLLSFKTTASLTELKINEYRANK